MQTTIIPFYTPTNKLIARAEGCCLYDSDGKKYIDFESGVWCTNIGHSNEQIVKRIKKQIRESVHHGYAFRNKQAEELSEKLQELIGYENGASVFLSSGSEAVNLSVTLARHFTGRKKILKIDNSYLSAYGYAQITDDNHYLVNVRCNDSAAAGKINFEEIAAFVVETGGASVEMVRFPDKEFVDKLIGLCRKSGCLIIADEVTTGIGRTGKWFGYQHYNFRPDMVVSGKALGNGFPVSAVTINAGLAEKFERKPFRYAQSHQNDPFGCAIALETIKIIEDQNLITRSAETGDFFKSRLNELKIRFPGKVKEIRARGLMLAVEFNESTDGTWIAGRLFEQGFVTGFKLNTLRFLPPLTIEHADISKMIGKLEFLLKNG